MVEERRETSRRDRETLGRAAGAALAATIEVGGRVWDRARMLPRLIPVGPDDVADESRAGRLAILVRLARALRGERVRGRAGHWSYSLDRHIGLVQAITAERRRFEALHGPLRDRPRPRSTNRDAPAAKAPIEPT